MVRTPINLLDPNSIQHSLQDRKKSASKKLFSDRKMAHRNDAAAIENIIYTVVLVFLIKTLCSYYQIIDIFFVT